MATLSVLLGGRDDDPRRRRPRRARLGRRPETFTLDAPGVGGDGAPAQEDTISIADAVPDAPQMDLPSRGEFFPGDLQRRRRGVALAGLGGALATIVGGGGQGPVSPVTAAASGLAAGASEEVQFLDEQLQQRQQAFVEALQQAREENLEARETASERRFELGRTQFEEQLGRQTTRMEERLGRETAEFEEGLERETIQTREEAERETARTREELERETDRMDLRSEDERLADRLDREYTRARIRAQNALADRREERGEDQTGEDAEVQSGMLDRAITLENQIETARAQVQELQGQRGSEGSTVTSEEIANARERVRQLQDELTDVRGELEGAALETYRDMIRRGEVPTLQQFLQDRQQEQETARSALEAFQDLNQGNFERGQGQNGQTQQDQTQQQTGTSPGARETLSRDVLRQAIQNYNQGEMSASDLIELAERHRTAGVISEGQLSQITNRLRGGTNGQR